MENEGSRLSKQVKRLNYGQFLFLYLVVLNTSFHFSLSLLEELRLRGAPDWGKTKGQKRKDKDAKRSQDELELPAYDSRSGSYLDVSKQEFNQQTLQDPQLEGKSRYMSNYPELSIQKENIEMTNK